MKARIRGYYFCLILIGIIIFSAASIFAANIEKLDPHVRSILMKNRDLLEEIKQKTMKGEQPGKVPNVKALLVFQGSKEDLENLNISVRSQSGNVFSVLIPLNKLETFSDDPRVIFVEASRKMMPELDVSRYDVEVDHVHEGSPGYDGTDVIVGIIDTGIDSTHEDFIDDSGNTRILFIWDQKLDPEVGENSPVGFGYGVEYDSADIDAGGIRHTDSDGHGTHVAGIAAGDGSATGNGEPADTYIGMAPDADIIVVKNTTTTDALGDSSQLFDAINYIFQKAQSLGKPAVINISQGDNLGPHDGSSLLEIGIDNLLEAPGRAVVKSAGNAGRDKIHASGTITQDTTIEVPFVVPANDSSEDAITIWYEGIDMISVSVRSPAGGSQESTPFVTLGENNSSAMANGNDIEIVSSLTNPLNGSRNILIKMLPGSMGNIEDGMWHLLIRGDSISSGSFDAWIERGEVIPAFDTPFVDDSKTISIPGTAKKVITVGAYTTKVAWIDEGDETHTLSYDEGAITYFSSLGPTRDGRNKPDISAPGQVIGSSLSVDADQEFKSFLINGDADDGILQDGVHAIAQGTSMAAPHVAGTIALLFEKSADYTNDEIKQRLIANAKLDAFTSADQFSADRDFPNGEPGIENIWGAGKLDAKRFIDGGQYISGVISEDTVWEARNGPYIITSDVTVNAKLTIEPGTVVKFDVDRTAYYGGYQYTKRLIVNGTLDAQGTVSEPIYFTSLYDDSAETGGDTNNDGALTHAAAGDWGYIRFNGSDSSDSVLRHVEVRYGGLRDDDGGSNETWHNYMVWANGASPEISDCLFRDVYATAVRYDSNPLDLSFTNNTIADGTTGLGVYSSSATMLDALITGNAITVSGSGVYVEWGTSGSVEITGSTIVADNAVTVSVNADTDVGVSNNIIDLTASGKGVSVTSGDDCGVNVAGNTITGGGTGIYSSSGSYAVVVVDNNAITGAGTGISMILADMLGTPAQVTNNTVTDGTDVLLMNGGLYTVSNNDFSGAGYKLRMYGTLDVTYSGNTIDWTGKKGVPVSGLLSQDEIWSATKSFGQPYVITSDVTVNAKLTIEPGTVVKFDVDRTAYYGGYQYTKRLIVNGTLDAQGTVSEPIYFTSLYDDSAETGGDTNNDGALTHAAAGDWGYIRFNGSDSSDSVLRHVEVRYGGLRDDDGGSNETWHNYMVWANGASPVVCACVFRSAYNHAIHYDNLIEIPDVYYTSFEDIDGNAVNNSSSIAVNAKYNYWGADDGPSGVGPGTGEPISSNVEYDPWLVSLDECTRDWDGDGMIDSFEMFYGLLPFDSSDRDEDADGDGVSNYHEYIAGTNPIVDESYPHINLVPIASAGPDQHVGQQKSVTLSASNSFDPDGWLVQYHWDQISGEPVTLADATSELTTFTSPVVDSNGICLVFMMTVTDNEGLMAQEESIINVSWDNLPPHADAGIDQIVNEDETVILDASASWDSDDDTLTYSWIQRSGIPVSLSDSNAVAPTFTSPQVDEFGNTLIFELMVDDPAGLQARDMVVINVTWENNPPVASAGFDQFVAQGTAVTLDGSASYDDDNGISQYIWKQVSGLPVILSDSYSETPTFTAPENIGYKYQDLLFQLTVMDNDGLEVHDICTITVERDEVPNDFDSDGDFDGSDLFRFIDLLIHNEVYLEDVEAFSIDFGQNP